MLLAWGRLALLVWSLLALVAYVLVPVYARRSTIRRAGRTLAPSMPVTSCTFAAGPLQPVSLATWAAPPLQPSNRRPNHRRSDPPATDALARRPAVR